MVRSGGVAARRSIPVRRPRVLVVDDYPSVREWMTRRLRLAEIDVLDAATGEDAVAIARREKLDLALIDYRLPGINGVETAVAIQQAGVSLPWILFSGTEHERAGRLAVQNGALRVLWGQFDVYAEGGARRSMRSAGAGRMNGRNCSRHTVSKNPEPRSGTAHGGSSWRALLPPISHDCAHGWRLFRAPRTASCATPISALAWNHSTPVISCGSCARWFGRVVELNT